MAENKHFFLLLLAIFIVSLPSITMAFKTQKTEFSNILYSWRMPILAFLILILIFFMKY
jgi:hypothetical protein